MRVSVRPLAEGDRPHWLRMRCALWPDDDAQHAREVGAWVADGQHEPLAVLVAELDGNPAGFAELSVRPCAEGCRTQRVAYLEGWFVEPAWRLRGVGRALVRAAESWATANGCCEFASDTQADNAASIAAHKACGFRDAGQVQCFVRKL